MKKRNCIHYEPVIESSYRYLGHNDFTTDKALIDEVETLIDEVCHCKEKGGPLHHNEYDCTNCPFYKGVNKWIDKKRSIII